MSTERRDEDVQEFVPVDKVNTRLKFGRVFVVDVSDVVDDEVDLVRATTNGCIERTRPGLRIRRQNEWFAPDLECKRLQLVILVGGDLGEFGRLVQGSAGHGLVFLKRTCE